MRLVAGVFVVGLAFAGCSDGGGTEAFCKVYDETEPRLEEIFEEAQGGVDTSSLDDLEAAADRLDEAKSEVGLST